MKKILLFVFTLLFACVAFAQTITINSIGMHGAGGSGDFEVEEGESITINVNYNVTGLVRPNKILGSTFDGVNNQILLSFYSSATPNDDDWADEISFPVLAFTVSQNGTHNKEFLISSDVFVDGAKSIQASLALYTNNGYYSSEYSSYCEDSIYWTVVPADSPIAGFQNYLTVYKDEETKIPTLYTPSSPTAATYDNNTLLIDFKLTEPPLTNSVKLYFSPNANGSNPTTTLTLAPDLQNTTRHQITLDASDFSTASPHLSDVAGETYLTELNTYYVAIGYQDDLGNPEATSPWHKLVYDNTAIPPSSVSAITGSENSNFDVSFTLSESSKNDGITIHIKDNSNAIVTSIKLSGIYASGAHTITLNGSNLLSSTGILSVSEDNELISGSFYKVAVGIIDLAGNTSTSTNSAPFQFFNADTSILAITAEYNPTDALAGYNEGKYQAIGYVALKTSSGSATLSGIEFDVGGTIDVGDASHLALYVSPNNGFAGATQLGNTLPFTGVGKYTFAIDNASISNVYKYYFVAVKLNSVGLTYDDIITLTTKDTYISTSGTVDPFNATDFAIKCLYKALIVNYFDDFPSITPGSSNAPFFRLDLRTNDCKTSITSINLDLTGTLTSNDVINGGFKLWESTSKTFNPNSAKAIRQLGGNANYNNFLEFSVFSSEISAVEKYFFFTVSTKATANTEATIGGDILGASAITATGNPVIETDSSLNGFPLTGDQQTLPVELSSFTAVLTSGNTIAINWTVESETGLSGYHILRSNSNDLNTATTIPVLIHAVNTSQTYTYTFVDNEIDLTKSEYYYWLMTVELSSESETFGPIMVRIENGGSDTPFINLGTTLIGNYPNPFNPSTSISFSLDKPENVVIDIYNIKGQLVRKLYNESVTKINQRINVLWDGKNNNGASAASGVYYARMTAGKHSESKKMILMK